ncbi:hypothetical protein HK100_003121 [Physocladia obscura]|uniref:N-acetyltransferase domain-containing protein n=1 Tax=Physocladia obscura TaxID=109957 RepID=A0AAD5T7P2_9FUNG|nr:hypothetical protein HK100_003121 [Physocladia obscura]
MTIPRSLPVPSHPHVHLTGIREEDYDSFCQIYGGDSPRRKAYFQSLVKHSRDNWNQWNNSSNENTSGEPVFPKSWPFIAIRLVTSISDDGTVVGPFLGELSTYRWGYDFEKGTEQYDSLVKINEERLPGDSELIWMIGYSVSADYRRQGIASAAVDVLVEWLHAVMGSKVVVACCAVENIASAGLLARCNFTKVKEYQSSLGRMDYGGMLYWEHVKNGGGVDKRKIYRKNAEKKRRDALKICYERLNTLLPQKARRRPKTDIVELTTEYILELETEGAEKSKLIAELDFAIEKSKGALA